MPNPRTISAEPPNSRGIRAAEGLGLAGVASVYIYTIDRDTIIALRAKFYRERGYTADTAHNFEEKKIGPNNAKL